MNESERKISDIEAENIGGWLSTPERSEIPCTLYTCVVFFFVSRKTLSNKTNCCCTKLQRINDQRPRSEKF